MRNQDIRKDIKQSGVRQWMIAEKLGISDVTLCRRLRKELPEPEKKNIRNAIDSILKVSKGA